MMAAYSGIWILLPLINLKKNLVKVGPPLSNLSGSAHGLKLILGMIEYHFVIICPAYSHLRQQYINPYYYRHPSVYKFTLLMKSTKLGTLKKIR